jgi:hypothetical protein
MSPCCSVEFGRMKVMGMHAGEEHEDFQEFRKKTVRM